MKTWSILCVGLLGFVVSGGASGVEYQVTFDATWSAPTHPVGFPSGPHFSSLVGAAHNDAVTFWQPGEPASLGVERVAESGSALEMRNEIAAAVEAGNALPAVSVGGFNSPAQRSLSIEVDQNYPLVTLISMIAPSPDWFIGVDSLDLRQGEQWMTQRTLDLYPWDAGTEDGNAYSLSNPASDPLGVVSRLDLDPTSILFESLPFGTLEFTLVPVCDFNGDGNCDTSDLSSVDGLYSVGDLEVGVDAIGELARFDLTGDARVNAADLDQWLTNAAFVDGFAEPYLKGDTNLNDHVGFGDFTGLSANFGMGREWTEGNYRGSGTSGFADFLLLSQNFGKQIPRLQAGALQSVPEPSAMLLLVFGGIALAMARRQRDWGSFTA